MTTRDPRRGLVFPETPIGGSSGREATQSLSLSADEADEASHPSLALGTHEAAAAKARDQRTRIESPQARDKPVTQPPAKKPPPVPKGSDEPDRVGQILGSYKVLEILGRGGMGFVFKAEHTKLGREVALKLLRTDYAKRRDAVARFFQEARTVNRVRHRNIVDVTDFVELDDGTTFIIMELLSGTSLGRWARTGIDLPRALAVLVQICDGLAAAHQVGVIHRDLKPDNVIVIPTSDGAELVKLLDFGVAKLLNHGDEDIGFQTAAGSVIGTPAYMSPEQAGGMAVDARSDIYSLGAIMYELFCGTPMFRGRSFGEYVRKHLTEMPVPPSKTELGRSIDPRLEAVIMKALQKEPDQRFANIGELRDSLLGILGGMETRPPEYATLAGSGVRAAVAVLPTTILPMPASMPSGGQPITSGPQTYQPASYVSPPSTHLIGGTKTPLTVWLIGGAIAVGLGVTAAVWYANRSIKPLVPPEPRAVAQPTAQPIEEAQPKQQVELHFDSTPSGAVFALDGNTELCKTPCTFSVERKPDEANRIFVVRANGFKESQVVVDLSGSANHEYKVELPREATIPTIADPVTPPEKVITIGGSNSVEEKPEKVVTIGGEKDPPPKPKTGKKSGKTTKTVEKQTVEPPPPEKDPPKVEPPPEIKKPKDKDKIDQTQTLDPFHKLKK